MRIFSLSEAPMFRGVTGRRKEGRLPLSDNPLLVPEGFNSVSLNSRPLRHKRRTGDGSVATLSWEQRGCCNELIKRNVLLLSRPLKHVSNYSTNEYGDWILPTNQQNRHHNMAGTSAEFLSRWPTGEISISVFKSERRRTFRKLLCELITIVLRHVSSIRPYKMPLSHLAHCGLSFATQYWKPRAWTPNTN